MKYKKRIPEPEIMTGSGQFAGCYAWAIDCNGLRVLGDTKAECIQEYKRAMFDEYGINL